MQLLLRKALTWDTGSKLVRELRDEVIVDAIFHRSEHNDRPRVVNCSTAITRVMQTIEIISASHPCQNKTISRDCSQSLMVQRVYAAELVSRSFRLNTLFQNKWPTLVKSCLASEVMLEML